MKHRYVGYEAECADCNKPLHHPNHRDDTPIPGLITQHLYRHGCLAVLVRGKYFGYLPPPLTWSGYAIGRDFRRFAWLSLEETSALAWSVDQSRGEADVHGVVADTIRALADTRRDMWEGQLYDGYACNYCNRGDEVHVDRNGHDVLRVHNGPLAYDVDDFRKGCPLLKFPADVLARLKVTAAVLEVSND